MATNPRDPLHRLHSDQQQAMPRRDQQNGTAAPIVLKPHVEGGIKCGKRPSPKK